MQNPYKIEWFCNTLPRDSKEFKYTPQAFCIVKEVSRACTQNLEEELPQEESQEGEAPQEENQEEEEEEK